ncbi:MAG TPA: ABC-F family ATP-binding cassette domain-containing protein [Candidatus Anaerobutyricum avicola]|nr:ABC-F family ATP-binding cassette domain-containing protein [Candidatus Anaerobutyricum avicola]
MILACQKITKAFGGDTILQDINFIINEGEKAALIGINGAGKTTLLKIITGEYEADSGEVVLQRGATMGYLSQVIDVTSRRTIYEEMLDAKKDIIEMEQKIHTLEQDISRLSGEKLENAMESYSLLTDRFEKSNGYAWKSEIVGVLKGLGFTEAEFDTPIHTLSGGQKTRVALSRILLTQPDIILLDEPTNHLDMDAIRWLETFLSNYRGAVLIVSHDRYFLDRVVSKVIEIEAGKSQTFLGSYSQYAEKKKAQRDAQMKLYLNQQQEIRHQEDVITKLRSFNREKSIRRAESREKMLNKMELVDKPVVLNSRMRISLEPEVISGNDVLTIENLSKSFENKPLFRNLNLSIHRGEVVGLLGANGTGKTTLLKIINRHLRPDSGKIHYGAKVSIGYYDQEQHVLNDENTIFDEISDAYPKLTNTRIRNVLAAFLFTGDRVFQKIGTLSGGEKGRVSLAKLMLSNANFLILDEPTNHLDIQSREILEDAINDYEGTVFYVSHDRYFINQTATRILDLSPDGIVNYKGNYTYYLEQKEAGNIEADSDSVLSPPAGSDETAASSAGNPSSGSSKEDWKRSREEAARQRKRANELKKTEAEISRLEEENETIKNEMNDPEIGSNVSRLMELSRQYEENEEALLELYEKWEELSEE